MRVGERGPAERSAKPPFTGVPPPPEEYRARGRRRLAALIDRPFGSSRRYTHAGWRFVRMVTALRSAIERFPPDRRRAFPAGRLE